MLSTGDDDHATVYQQMNHDRPFQETESFYPVLRKPSKININIEQRWGNTNLNYDVAV